MLREPMTSGLRTRLTHWLLPNGRTQPHAPVAVWLTRLQQDDNPWLSGERLEQQGQLADARRHYLQDADRERARGQHARAAIAHAASAALTARLGDEGLARWERERAADQMRLHAERAVEWSLREAAWAYARAASFYDAASRADQAAEMRRCAEDVAAHLGLPADGLDVHLRLPANGLEAPAHPGEPGAA
jgi:hypothetical protein